MTEHKPTYTIYIIPMVVAFMFVSWLLTPYLGQMGHGPGYILGIVALSVGGAVVWVGLVVVGRLVSERIYP